MNDMRKPRNIDVIGTGILLLSLGLWFSYERTGKTAALLAFFLAGAVGLAVEPISHRVAHRRTARERHPVMRGRRKA